MTARIICCYCLSAEARFLFDQRKPVCSDICASLVCARHNCKHGGGGVAIPVVCQAGDQFDDLRAPEELRNYSRQLADGQDGAKFLKVLQYYDNLTLTLERGITEARQEGDRCLQESHRLTEQLRKASASPIALSSNEKRLLDALQLLRSPSIDVGQRLIAERDVFQLMSQVYHVDLLAKLERQLDDCRTVALHHFNTIRTLTVRMQAAERAAERANALEQQLVQLHVESNALYKNAYMGNLERAALQVRLGDKERLLQQAQERLVELENEAQKLRALRSEAEQKLAEVVNMNEGLASEMRAWRRRYYEEEQRNMRFAATGRFTPAPPSPAQSPTSAATLSESDKHAIIAQYLDKAAREDRDAADDFNKPGNAQKQQTLQWAKDHAKNNTLIDEYVGLMRRFYTIRAKATFAEKEVQERDAKIADLEKKLREALPGANKDKK